MKEDWNGILVYLEQEEGRLLPVSRELLGEAFRLAEKKNVPVFGVGITNQIARLKKTLEGYPLKRVYLYEYDLVFQVNQYERALRQCVDEIRPEIFLIGGTAMGRALAPAIAVAYRTGLTADCTELDIDDYGNLIQTRPAFGGNVMASILTEKARPQLATVRPGILIPLKEGDCRKPTFIRRKLEEQGRRAKILDIRKIQIEASIAEQSLLVAVGRGIKRKEDLTMMRRLARLLGGGLASSRALVEKGWMKSEEQIGLSGTAVKPDCILTFGISGSVQFQAGMKHASNIISINTDPNAGIFEIAHYPICGDLYEIVPEWLKILEQ